MEGSERMTDTLQGVREAALVSGLNGMTDADALALFLARSTPRKAFDHAAALMRQFQSLDAVLAAPLADLQAVVGKAALDVKLLHALAGRAAAAPLRKRSVISSWSALLAWVKVEYAHRRRECFAVLFLDRRNQLIAHEILNEGTIDHAPVYPREIVRRALQLEASSLILVHNHPSGDPTPSSQDVDMTRAIVEAARPLKISVHDHLVVGSAGVASFRALGLF